MPSQPVRPLRPADTEDASAVLGRAFFDDPMYIFLMPDAARRRRQIDWLLQTTIRYGMRYGHVMSLGDSVEGVANWLPPGSGEMTSWRMLQLGAGASLWRLGLEAVRRSQATITYCDSIRHDLMRTPFWHLLVLGIDPPRQGQGGGSRLLAPTLAEIDAMGLPAYLESSKEQNLAFYAKQGFTVVHEGVLPHGGPPIWMMRRLPGGTPA